MWKHKDFSIGLENGGIRGVKQTTDKRIEGGNEDEARWENILRKHEKLAKGKIN